MSWAEFSTLLNGIMPKTPLGQVVSIRSEENPDTLKYFTKEQKRIRDEWRTKQAKQEIDDMDEQEKLEKLKEVSQIFSAMAE
jgi:Bacteriophage Gp15 protein.